MVKVLQKDNSALYVCEACNFAYKTRELAEKCQQWCEERHSCNLEIAQHAVPLE